MASLGTMAPLLRADRRAMMAQPVQEISLSRLSIWYRQPPEDRSSFCICWAERMAFRAFGRTASIFAWRGGSTMPETSERRRVDMLWLYIGPWPLSPRTSMPLGCMEARMKSTPLLSTSPYGPTPGVWPFARNDISASDVTPVTFRCTRDPPSRAQAPSFCCSFARNASARSSDASSCSWYLAKAGDAASPEARPVIAATAIAATTSMVTQQRDHATRESPALCLLIVLGHA